MDAIKEIKKQREQAIKHFRAIQLGLHIYHNEHETSGRYLNEANGAIHACDELLTKLERLATIPEDAFDMEARLGDEFSESRIALISEEAKPDDRYIELKAESESPYLFGFLRAGDRVLVYTSYPNASYFGRIIKRSKYGLIVRRDIDE